MKLVYTDRSASKYPQRRHCYTLTHDDGEIVVLKGGAYAEAYATKPEQALSDLKRMVWDNILIEQRRLYDMMACLNKGA